LAIGALEEMGAQLPCFIMDPKTNSDNVCNDLPVLTLKNQDIGCNCLKYLFITMEKRDSTHSS
jgi:hypothetical protein